MEDIADEDESADLNSALRYLDLLLNQYAPLWGDAWLVEPGSVLAADDALTDPFQLSHCAHLALQVAVDNLACLRNSLVGHNDDGAYLIMHVFGQATLLRAALENSARAVWMLAPDNPLERTRRRLAIQNKDNDDLRSMEKVSAAAYVDGTPQPAQDATERAAAEKRAQLEHLVDRFTAAGATQTDTKSKSKALVFPGYTDVVREAGKHLPAAPTSDDRLDLGNTLVLAWKGCSSLAHGDLNGALTQLCRDLTAEADGVQQIHLTGSASNLLHWTQLTCMTASTALRLFAERAEAHT